MNATNIPTTIIVKIKTDQTLLQFVFEEYIIQANNKLTAKKDTKIKIKEGKNISAFALIKVLIVSFI